eukprot:70775_1
MPAPKSKNRSNKRKSKGRTKPKQNNKNKNKGKGNKNTVQKPATKQEPTKINDDDNKVEPSATSKIAETAVKSNKCSNCSKPNAESLCGGCKKIYYCNQDCQAANWKKHKNLCDYIQKQNKQIKNDLFAAKNINVKGNYVKRIDLLLNVYKQFIENNGKYNEYGSIYELISAHYPGLRIDYFVHDYAKYVQNIDDNNIYKDNDTKCDITQCKYIQRQYRDPNIYDTNSNNEARYKLYHNCQSEESVVISQFLDALHIVKYHLFDIGLKYNMDVNDTDEKLQNMMIELQEKRQIFNKLRKDIKPNAKNKFPNKFVTEIILEEEEKSNDEQKNNDQQQQKSYGFGFRFYYHNYFKNNKNTKEEIPGGFGMHDFGNTSINPAFTFKQWYIVPKYKDIKQEVLNSINHKLTMIQYENTLKKATMKYNALKKNIRGAVAIWANVYGIPQGSSVTLNHIFALLLYTNNITLSCEFAKSYRKLFPSETYDSVKQRHSVYANWAKALREIVECFGTFLEQARFNMFYHAISCKMLFSKLKETFAMPMSTTLNYSTAVMFSNEASIDGMVITFANDFKPALFFACVQFSDYPGEVEMLFIGGLTLFQISGLSSIGMKIIAYDRYIESIKIFEAVLVNAQTLPEPISVEQRDTIKGLIGTVLKNNKRKQEKDCDEKETVMDKKENKCKDIPIYVELLFKNLLNKIGRVTIDIERLSKNKLFADKLNGVQYGGHSLSHFYLTDKNEGIKWDVLQKLFPSLWTIHISRSRKILNVNGVNEFRFMESIKITKNLLKSVLKHLSEPKNDWGWIDIHFPANQKNQLNQLIDSYQNAFNKKKFKLLMKKSEHSQYGSCQSFCIHQM